MDKDTFYNQTRDSQDQNSQNNQIEPKKRFKIGLKHWTGTLIIAVIAGLVIFGLIRGQEFLAKILIKREVNRAEELPKAEEKLNAPINAPLIQNIVKITPKITSPPISTSTSTPTPSSEPSNLLDAVVINEIAWMGTIDSTSDEWIELKNNTNQEIGLTGWILAAEDGTPSINLTGKIKPNGFYLLERTNDDTIKNTMADQFYTGALENSGEILKLYDKDGDLQDIVGHKDSTGQEVPWYAGDNTTKSTMGRIDSNKPGTDPTNWQTISGTPKGQNNY